MQSLSLSTALNVMSGASGAAVAPHVAWRVSEFARGSIDTVREIAGMLSPSELGGEGALPALLPTVDSARSAELATLRTAERRALLFAALSETRLVSDLLDAAAIDLDILLFGSLRRFLSVENGRVSHLDPRVEAQVVHDADKKQRIEAHEAFARVARRHGNTAAVIWHRAMAGPPESARANHALLAAAEDRLALGDIRAAGALAELVVDSGLSEELGRACVIAGIAAFWSGEFGDVLRWMDRAVASGHRSSEPNTARRVIHLLRDGRDGSTYSLEEAVAVFESMGELACNPFDRTAMSQLAAVAHAVYERPREADGLQARLFLSLGKTDAARPSSLTPHAEAHVAMMQTAFMNQAGDRAGAARVLLDAVHRLPLVHCAAGVVASYIRILAPYEPAFDETLAAAYEAIGPARPLRYDGNGASIGHGPEVGLRAAAAAALFAERSASVPAPDVVTSETLSARQSEVVTQMIRGKSNRDIADALGISPRTVEVHIGHILRKYEVRSRSELLAKFAGWNRPTTRDI